MPLQPGDVEPIDAAPFTQVEGQGAHVSGDDPPFLLGHGTLDPSVPYDQSVTFLTALKNAGVPAVFIRFEDGGHIGGGPRFHERRQVFFDKYLRGQKVEVPAAPIPFPAARP